jgi:hypothetical protein
MALHLPLPERDDPVRTAANGFVVRKDAGVIRGH